MQERDQILVINGSPLEPGISQQQALTLLQQPGENVELVVARERTANAPPPPSVAPVNTVSNGTNAVFMCYGNYGKYSLQT